MVWAQWWRRLPLPARSIALSRSITVAALALPRWLAFLSPMCFALMGPGHWLCGMQSEKRRHALAKELEPEAFLQPRT